MQKTLNSLKFFKSKDHNFCKNHSTKTKVNLNLQLFIIRLHTKKQTYLVGAFQNKGLQGAESLTLLIFCTSRAITLTRSLKLYNEDHFCNGKLLAKHNRFGDVCKNLLSDSYVLFLGTAVKFFNRSKIQRVILLRISYKTKMPNFI